MQIVNILSSKVLGGIESAYIDYCKALIARGHSITAIIHSRAEIKNELLKLPLNIVEDSAVCHTWSKYTPLPYLRFFLLIRKIKPDAVIVHNGRMVSMFRKLTRNKCQLIAVNHSCKAKRTIGADKVITVNEKIQEDVIKAGQIPSRVYVFPNMIEIPSKSPYPINFRAIPIICTICRFTSEKGLDILFNALYILKENGVIFKFILAGDGKEKNNLIELSKKLNLDKEIEFCGWIDDKSSFFESVDIFCMPSRHESFGIALLEAMSYAKPSIATECDGPKEIISNEKNGILVERNNPKKLADALQKLITDETFARKIAQEGYKTVKSKYCINKLAQKLENIIKD